MESQGAVGGANTSIGANFLHPMGSLDKNVVAEPTNGSGVAGKRLMSQQKRELLDRAGPGSIMIAQKKMSANRAAEGVSVVVKKEGNKEDGRHLFGYNAKQKRWVSVTSVKDFQDKGCTSPDIYGNDAEAKEIREKLVLHVLYTIGSNNRETDLKLIGERGEVLMEYPHENRVDSEVNRRYNAIKSRKVAPKEELEDSIYENISPVSSGVSPVSSGVSHGFNDRDIAKLMDIQKEVAERKASGVSDQASESDLYEPIQVGKQAQLRAGDRAASKERIAYRGAQESRGRSLRFSRSSAIGGSHTDLSSPIQGEESSATPKFEIDTDVAIPSIMLLGVSCACEEGMNAALAKMVENRVIGKDECLELVKHLHVVCQVPQLEGVNRDIREEMNQVSAAPAQKLLDAVCYDGEALGRIVSQFVNKESSLQKFTDELCILCAELEKAQKGGRADNKEVIGSIHAIRDMIQKVQSKKPKQKESLENKMREAMKCVRLAKLCNVADVVERKRARAQKRGVELDHNSLAGLKPGVINEAFFTEFGSFLQDYSNQLSPALKATLRMGSLFIMDEADGTQKYLSFFPLGDQKMRDLNSKPSNREYIPGNSHVILPTVVEIVGKEMKKKDKLNSLGIFSYHYTDHGRDKNDGRLGMAMLVSSGNGSMLIPNYKTKELLDAKKHASDLCKEYGNEVKQTKKVGIAAKGKGRAAMQESAIFYAGDPDMQDNAIYEGGPPRRVPMQDNAIYEGGPPRRVPMQDNAIYEGGPANAIYSEVIPKSQRVQQQSQQDNPYSLAQSVRVSPLGAESTERRKLIGMEESHYINQDYALQGEGQPEDRLHYSEMDFGNKGARSLQSHSPERTEYEGIDFSKEAAVKSKRAALNVRREELQMREEELELTRKELKDGKAKLKPKEIKDVQDWIKKEELSIGQAQVDLGREEADVKRAELGIGQRGVTAPKPTVASRPAVASKPAVASRPAVASKPAVASRAAMFEQKSSQERSGKGGSSIGK